MTLDKAIEHAEQRVVDLKMNRECGKDQQQLVEWLQELKRFQAYEKIPCPLCSARKAVPIKRCFVCDNHRHILRKREAPFSC